MWFESVSVALRQFIQPHDDGCIAALFRVIQRPAQEWGESGTEDHTSIQKMNIDLVQTLTDERKHYKELIKCKGRVCHFCEKPIEFAS